LPASGRLKVTRASPASTSKRMDCSVMGFSCLTQWR
jgi:hypothetical protein